MLKNNFAFAVSVCICVGSLAQSIPASITNTPPAVPAVAARTADAPPVPALPLRMPAQPTPTAKPTSSTSAAQVDILLQRMMESMAPAPDAIDPQAETAISRDINVTRSTSQIVRPVGYLNINDTAMAFIEDNNKLVMISPHSQIGSVKITEINDRGVGYELAGKKMFAPLAFLAVDPPKAAQSLSQLSQQTGNSTNSAPTGGIASRK